MNEYYGILISFMLSFSRKVAENMLLQELVTSLNLFLWPS